MRKERHSHRSRGGGKGSEEEGEKISIELPLDLPPILADPAPSDEFKVEEYKDLNKGSFDIGDPLTTNLYVGNINPKVSVCLCVCEVCYV